MVYALESRYAVEAVDTESPPTPPRSAARPRAEGYDVVVAFGGDGTVNEAANGLAGSGTPLDAASPAARPTSYCRTLGIPGDVVDATEHLLRHGRRLPAPRASTSGGSTTATSPSPRGVGLDASVVERVDAHPRMKARARPVLLHLRRRSRRSPSATWSGRPHVRVRGRRAAARGRDGDRAELRPVHLTSAAGRSASCEGSGARQRHARRHCPAARNRRSSCRRCLWRAFSGNPATVARHRQIEAFSGVPDAHVEAIDGRAFPVQVDGDYLGEFDSVRFGVDPGACGSFPDAA